MLADTGLGLQEGHGDARALLRGPDQDRRGRAAHRQHLRPVLLQHAQPDQPHVPRRRPQHRAGLQRPSRRQDLRGRPGRLDLREGRRARHPAGAHGGEAHASRLQHRAPGRASSNRDAFEAVRKAGAGRAVLAPSSRARRRAGRPIRRPIWVARRRSATSPEHTLERRDRGVHRLAAEPIRNSFGGHSDGTTGRQGGVDQRRRPRARARSKGGCSSARAPPWCSATSSTTRARRSRRRSSASGGKATYVHLNVTREADWRAADRDGRAGVRQAERARQQRAASSSARRSRRRRKKTGTASWPSTSKASSSARSTRSRRCARPAAARSSTSRRRRVWSGAPGLHRRLHRDQGRRAVVHEVDGRPAREGRHPLQLRPSRADRDRHDQGRAREQGPAGAAHAAAADGPRRDARGRRLRRASTWRPTSRRS